LVYTEFISVSGVVRNSPLG